MGPLSLSVAGAGAASEVTGVMEGEGSIMLKCY